MRYLLIVLLSVHLFAVDATLKIEKDVEQRSRIAIEDASAAKDAQFFKILLSDFKISGHFLADTTYHKGSMDSMLISPSFKGKEYLLKYLLTKGGGAKLMIRLLRISDNKEIFKKSYAISSTSKVPFLAHKAISDVNKVLKYKDISWINRYVLFSRYTTAKHSEILLADYTFNYKKTIIKGGLNLFPKWADAEQKSFYYTSYSGLIPTLFKLNIYTGAKKKIASSDGMLICSDVSKNKSKILLTMAPNGQADIYELNVATGVKTRVTKFNGIDVGGKYVNDDTIIFVSNRLGYANVFKKSIHGASVNQVVHHGRNNNACDAYGSKVVYSSRESKNSFAANKFNLYLTSTSGTDTRPLTTTGTNQFPRFSPDGSVVLYIKHAGNGSSIGYINLESRQTQLYPLGGLKIQSIDW